MFVEASIGSEEIRKAVIELGQMTKEEHAVVNELARTQVVTQQP